MKKTVDQKRGTYILTLTEIRVLMTMMEMKLKEEKVDQRTVCERASISRSSVMEAVDNLQSAGLIKLHRWTKVQGAIFDYSLRGIL